MSVCKSVLKKRARQLGEILSGYIGCRLPSVVIKENLLTSNSGVVFAWHNVSPMCHNISCFYHIDALLIIKNCCFERDLYSIVSVLGNHPVLMHIRKNCKLKLVIVSPSHFFLTVSFQLFSLFFFLSLISSSCSVPLPPVVLNVFCHSENRKYAVTISAQNPPPTIKLFQPTEREIERCSSDNKNVFLQVDLMVKHPPPHTCTH